MLMATLKCNVTFVTDYLASLTWDGSMNRYKFTPYCSRCGELLNAARCWRGGAFLIAANEEVPC